MPFQQDADVFAHGATVGAGLPGQIVVERFGQMQLDIAVAFATTLFDGSDSGQTQGRRNGGTFGHGVGLHAIPRHNCSR